MKNLSKILGLNVLFLANFANAQLTTDPITDPIIGTWQVSINGKPKGTVAITAQNQTFIGKVTSGKKHLGKTVLIGLKADGNGKYSGGKLINPLNGMSFNSDISIKVNTATVKIYKGVKAFGFTQTWQRK